MSAVENTMTIDLQTVLPTLLPPAIQWAEARAREVELSCVLLKDDRISIARIAGVRKPEFIRIALVPTLPLPEHPDLRAAALQTVLLGPGMVGLTLGYSVLVCRDHDTMRLLSHEFRHVYRYESAGSIGAFLPIYLQQIVRFGYDNAQFEIDARSHEFDG